MHTKRRKKSTKFIRHRQRSRENRICFNLVSNKWVQINKINEALRITLLTKSRATWKQSSVAFFYPSLKLQSPPNTLGIFHLPNASSTRHHLNGILHRILCTHLLAALPITMCVQCVRHCVFCFMPLLMVFILQWKNHQYDSWHSPFARFVRSRR